MSSSPTGTDTHVKSSKKSQPELGAVDLQEKAKKNPEELKVVAEGNPLKRKSKRQKKDVDAGEVGGTKYEEVVKPLEPNEDTVVVDVGMIDEIRGKEKRKKRKREADLADVGEKQGIETARSSNEDSAPSVPNPEKKRRKNKTGFLDPSQDSSLPEQSRKG